MSGIMSLLRRPANEAPDASDVENLPKMRAAVRTTTYETPRVPKADSDAAGRTRPSPEERYPGSAAKTRRATLLETEVLRAIGRYGFGGTMAEYAARDIAHMIVYREEI